MADPFVQNAADKEQLNSAKTKEKFLRKRELSDFRSILETNEGRRIFWRILERCRVFESVWDPSAKIHYLSGQQDLGHWILAEILSSNKAAFFKMIEENKKEEQGKDQAEDTKEEER